MAPLTRDEYRRRVVSQQPKHLKFRTWASLILLSPAILVLFLGDILAAPFVARRNQSTGHWLLYLFVRCLVPLMLIGLGLGYFLRRNS